MTSLHRRRLLFNGAAIIATVATAAASARPTSAQAGAPSTSTNAGPVVVRWNSKTDRWAQRPAGAEFGVVFLSTNDAHATAPTDPHNMVGDVWRRHPDAVAA